MEHDDTTISAQFLGSGVSLISRDPLLGSFELVSSTGATIEVSLDRPSAEALLSALVQFLSQGQAAEFDDGM
ncbi:hypothetical protein PWG15_25230 (plasmid) [Ensifer adhaerens]|uniref:hypothetical protein n=1 Tax=Ensifer adhaerens TaxID=106592 RepID=UPI0023A929FD|nr:hypothetical protein [Ensifer adhaerens]WDZ81053.1 hypothetical protein PWG15_25230 [Ensifer adhaerens]